VQRIRLLTDLRVSALIRLPADGNNLLGTCLACGPAVVLAGMLIGPLCYWEWHRAGDDLDSPAKLDTVRD
jgi:hypothetical protein